MSHDPEAGRKLRQAIERYAQSEVGPRIQNLLAAVLYCFVPDDKAKEELESLLIDVVFRYLLAAASARYELTEGGPEFDRLLDAFLARHTRLTEERRNNFRKIVKQAVLTSRDERPKSEVKNRLLEKQRHLRCYLCGEEITEDDERLDHFWPHTAGGGTGQSNLWRAHTACQAVKHDLALPGDAPLGRFAFGGELPRFLSARPAPWWERTVKDEQEFITFMDDIRAAVCRIAMVVRQQGKCHKCEKEFRKLESTHLKRRESDLPWWLPNTVVVCGQCVKET